MPTPRLHPLARLAICALGLLLTQVAVMVVIMAALSFSAHVAGQPVAEVAMGFFERSALLATVLSYPPSVLCILICRRWLDRRSLISLGLRSPRFRVLLRDYGYGWVAGAAAISFWFMVVWLTGNIRVLGWSPEAFDAGVTASLGVLVLYAFAFLAVGFMEELLFRGYTFQNLAGWWGVRAALVAQAVAFALVHIANVVSPLTQASQNGKMPSLREVGGAVWDIRWGLVNIGLVGAFLALAYLKTGSLWFPVGFHAAWNFCLGCIFSLPVSGIKIFRLLDITETPVQMISGGQFGPEGSVFLLAIFGPMLYLLTQQRDHPQAQLDLGLLAPGAWGQAPVEAGERNPGLAELAARHRESRLQQAELAPATVAALRTISNSYSRPLSETFAIEVAPPTVVPEAAAVPESAHAEPDPPAAKPPPALPVPAAAPPPPPLPPPVAPPAPVALPLTPISTPPAPASDRSNPPEPRAKPPTPRW